MSQLGARRYESIVRNPMKAGRTPLRTLVSHLLYGIPFMSPNEIPTIDADEIAIPMTSLNAGTFLQEIRTNSSDTIRFPPILGNKKRKCSKYLKRHNRFALSSQLVTLKLSRYSLSPPTQVRLTDGDILMNA